MPRVKPLLRDMTQRHVPVPAPPLSATSLKVAYLVRVRANVRVRVNVARNVTICVADGW